MWENEIILGNAYELIKQIPNKSIDLICTDPPYQIEGLHIGTGVLKDRIPSKCRTGVLSNNYVYQMMNGNLGNGIDKTILDEYVRVMKNINIYLWCNKEQLMTYLDYFVKGLDCNFEIFIWGKINPPFTNMHFLKDKEYCLYFWKNITIKPKYDYAKTFYVGQTNIKDKDLYGHPTIKPEYIIDNFIRNSSKENDIVLDTFSGSGTTCVCAKKLNRRFIGFEINEDFYNISVDRLNGLTMYDKEAKESGQLKLF